MYIYVVSSSLHIFVSVFFTFVFIVYHAFDVIFYLHIDFLLLIN